MNPRVEGYLKEFRARGLGGSPLDEDQAKDLERHLGLALPAAYRAYLLAAGAEPPPGLVGSDCHGGYLFDLRSWADELLEECGKPFALPGGAVVFMMHQGYQFYYFMADGETEDPPVHYFIQGRDGPEQTHTRFTDWVGDMA